MSQATITERDLQQMVGIAQYAGDEAGDALPWELLHDLKRLVECDNLSVSGQDTPNWEFFADQEVPSFGDSSAEVQAGRSPTAGTTGTPRAPTPTEPATSCP